MADFDAPGRYVRANYEREDWLAVVLIYRNPALVKQEFATAERISKPSYQAHLRAANASGADVYLTVNALKAGATGRTKADVKTVRHVYLDLDGAGREAVERILQAPGMPAPHHILNTSPGKYQLIWTWRSSTKTRLRIWCVVLPRGMEPTRPCGMWRASYGFLDSGITNTKPSGTSLKTCRTNRPWFGTTAHAIFWKSSIRMGQANAPQGASVPILRRRGPEIRKASGIGSPRPLGHLGQSGTVTLRTGI